MTPIRTKDRLPTKEDASEDGWVWVWNGVGPYPWMAELYDLVEDAHHYWLPYSAIPLPEEG